jgi:hypothetical protein
MLAEKWQTRMSEEQAVWWLGGAMAGMVMLGYLIQLAIDIFRRK